MLQCQQHPHSDFSKQALPSHQYLFAAFIHQCITQIPWFLEPILHAYANYCMHKSQVSSLQLPNQQWKSCDISTVNSEYIKPLFLSRTVAQLLLSAKHHPTSHSGLWEICCSKLCQAIEQWTCKMIPENIFIKFSKWNHQWTISSQSCPKSQTTLQLHLQHYILLMNIFGIIELRNPITQASWKTLLSDYSCKQWIQFKTKGSYDLMCLVFSQSIQQILKSWSNINSF